MSSAPFMQLYVGDYLADTLHLTTEQHGAYLLLLMTMWRHDAALPNDAAKLARIARVSPKRWPAIWAEIEGFFVVDGDKITNRRLTKEHQKAVSISQERKTAASLGGKAKALKDKDARLANGSDLACHSQISQSEPDKNDDDCAGEPEEFFSDFHSRLTAIAGDKFTDQASRAIAQGWLRIPSLDAEAILQSVQETQAAAPHGQPISSLNYFTPELRKLASIRTQPPAEPASPSKAKRPARDHEALMRAAMARLNEDGSIRL